jgi:hypothetical protein
MRKTSTIPFRKWGLLIGVILPLLLGAVAVAREVSRNTAKIETFETWRQEYAKDFRDMRQEVKDIWEALYGDD